MLLMKSFVAQNIIFSEEQKGERRVIYNMVYLSMLTTGAR